ARYSVTNNENLINLDNNILKLPEYSGISEFRPNFMLSSNKIQLVARPRIRFLYEETGTGKDSQRSEGFSEAELNEGFASWFLSDQFSFTVGLQSFQWGPAEVLSPSNRLFHVTSLARDVLYEVRGKHIGRVNYSLGQNISVVLLSEYEQNKDEEPFVAE